MSYEIIHLSDPPPVDVSRLSAAALWGGLLAIVTVRSVRSKLRFDPKASTFLKLDDRDRAGSAPLAKQLVAFLEKNSIELLYLRKGPESGPKANSPVRTKIEFLVKHKAEIDVKFLPSHVVRRWVNQRDLVLPEAASPLSGEQRAAQREALEAAIYISAKNGGPI
ncbi:hypothetical protein [Tsuneonella sp. HG222]